jgi:hypothetical protein
MAGPGGVSKTSLTESALSPMPSGWISHEGFPLAMLGQISSMCAPSTRLRFGFKWYV